MKNATCQNRECGRQYTQHRDGQKFCSRTCQSRERYVTDVETGKRLNMTARRKQPKPFAGTSFPEWPGLS